MTKNREEFVKTKYDEVVQILFESGLSVGDITQILQGCTKNLNSLPVGQNKKKKV